MSDTFYAGNPGEAFVRDPTKITVGASTSAAQKLELRVTDGGCTAEQVYAFLERLADYFATRNAAVIVAGTLTG